MIPFVCRHLNHVRLPRVLETLRPGTHPPVELPQSREPPDRAQLDMVGSVSNPVGRSAGIVAPVTTPCASTNVSAAPTEKLPPENSRGWCWESASAQLFHVHVHSQETTRAHVIDARRWAWNNRSALPWDKHLINTLPAVHPNDPLVQQPQATSHQALQLPGQGVMQSRGSMCAHVHMTEDHVHVPAAGSALEPGWDSRKKTETYFPEDVWDMPYKPPYVHVVNTAAAARRAMQLLRGLVEADKVAARSHAPVSDYGRQYWSRRIFACDTEVRCNIAAVCCGDTLVH